MSDTKPAPIKIPVLPPFAITVNGEQVIVDSSTFSLREHRTRRRELTRISIEEDLVVEATDVVAASIWTVLRRADPTLTIEDVYDAVTLGEARDAIDSPVNPDDPSVGASTDPEA
jgi:hypothetical protein